MHMKQWTAISLLAAMGALAGCGADEGGEPTAMDDTEYNDAGYNEDPGYQTTEESVPPPESSVAGGELGEPGDDPMMDDSTTVVTTTPSDSTSQTDSGMQSSQDSGSMGTTEFAALDTDSDGKLAESEWKPDAVSGKEFSEIDEDSSGDIDRDEFRQAISSSGSQSGSSDETTSQ